MLQLRKKEVSQPAHIKYSFLIYTFHTSVIKSFFTNRFHILSNNKFIAQFDTSFKKNKHDVIDVFINQLKGFIGKGTKNEIWNLIKPNLPKLDDKKYIKKIVDLLRLDYDGKEDIVYYLQAIQLVSLYWKNPSLFENHIERAKYLLKKEELIQLFISISDTWKGIKPKELGNNLVVEIDNSYDLSNGERDILVFFSLLQVAKTSLKKTSNILIIDEVFDYLDDANLIAAQYYLLDMIEEFKSNGKELYPIILTHLDPNYFKEFSFKKSKLKIVYFNENSIPCLSSKMETLIKRRDKLKKDETDLISKYMLHYHPSYEDMTVALGSAPELIQWKNLTVFSDYCKEQTENYCKDLSFDPFAVCIHLRRCIEKYLYDNLNDIKKKEIF